jgi:hypothetical protein
MSFITEPVPYQIQFDDGERVFDEFDDDCMVVDAARRTVPEYHCHQAVPFPDERQACSRASQASPSPSPYPSSRSRLVFLHYLPWFTLDATNDSPQARRGWCGTKPEDNLSSCPGRTRKQYVGPPPLIGEYDQRNVHVLEHHLLLAHSAGVDVLLVNCNPTDPLQFQITELLFRTAASMRKKYGDEIFRLQLAVSYDNERATTREMVVSDFTKLATIFNSNVEVTFVADDGAGSGGSGGSGGGGGPLICPVE